MSDWFLGDDDLALLGDDELAAYLAAIEAAPAEWTLDDNPKQLRAEALAHEVDELMYGGAAGGGKTDWLLWHAWHLSAQNPGHKTLALRRTFPQLKDSLILRSIEKYSGIKDDDGVPLARYYVGDKEWVWRNGSRLRFGFCDTDDDVRHYLSTEYDLIIFEELTEFTERQFTLVCSRNRTTALKRARGIRPHVIAATNPGQVGHAWVKRRFVTSTGYGEHVASQQLEYMGRKRERTVAFVPARVDDNPHIDPDYVFNLMTLPEIEQRQYLYGDWDTFAGQYFTEWNHDIHVVEPFAIPKEWVKIRGIDYGTTAQYACLWAAFDWDGNCYIYREAYERGLTAKEQALAVVKATREDIKYTVADPSIWAKGATGISISQMYREAGLPCRKALNARIDGWSRFRDWLRGSPDPKSDHFGPTLRVFNTCPNFIRTVPEMIHDKDRPEDLDTDGEDHLPDAGRYLLMSRPRRARKARDQAGPMTAERVAKEAIEQASRGSNKERHPILGKVRV